MRLPRAGQTARSGRAWAAARVPARTWARGERTGRSDDEPTPKGPEPDRGQRYRHRARTTVAVFAGRLAGWLSRRLGVGSGSVIAGRAAMFVYRDVLAGLAQGRTIAIVSGTNGKTTTSHLLATALAERGPAAHNAAGSNMTDGAVAALIAAPRARLAVLEVDELHLAAVLDATRPDLLVLLNLSRDQLDRVSEVRRTARAVREVVARHRDTAVVANVDDPLVAWPAHAAARVEWVSPGARWQADSLACPACGHRLTRHPQHPEPRPKPDDHPAPDHPPRDRSDSGGRAGWSCSRCGLHRPTPRWWWSSGDGDDALDEPVVHWPGGAPVALRLSLPGQVNLGNATFALAAAAHLGTDPSSAAARLAGVRAVSGRYAQLSYRDRQIRALLVKNPAGWSETLDMLVAHRPLLIVINAREADGRDVSWLWDLPVETLRQRPIAVAGSRAADLGVRLGYAEIPHYTDPDPLSALDHLPVGDVDALANYTAFLDLQHHLTEDSATRRGSRSATEAGCSTTSRVATSGH